MEIPSSLQLHPLQVVGLLLKQLDAFVVASKGGEQINGSVCATTTEGNPILGSGSGGCPPGDTFCLWIELPSIRIYHKGELLITNAPGKKGGRPR